MSLKYTTLLKRPLLSLSLGLKHELDVTVRLLQSNIMGFSFIFLGGLFSRVIRSPMPITETVKSANNTIIVGLLCNYIFDIANQASSPQEDYLNKPNRPIPAGLISIDQANGRWLLAWTLGPVIIYFCFGIWATLHLFHFEAFIFVCYVWPRWFSWFMRSYFAAFSYFILARLLDQTLARNMPNWSISCLIDFIIFLWLMGTVHIQDFYDLEGDRKSDRTTLPMLLSDKGLKVLRAGTATFIIAFGLSLLLIGHRDIYRDKMVASICLLQQISSYVLAKRIWASSSIEMDRTTYRYYYYPSAFMVMLSLTAVMK